MGGKRLKRAGGTRLAKLTAMFFLLRCGVAWGQGTESPKVPQLVEFNDAFQSVNSSQVKRSAYAKLTWQF
jgi:hypothetical protein